MPARFWDVHDDSGEEVGGVEGLERVTIDEVQRSPQILSLLKMEVDRNPTKGRFLLTGSADRV